MNAQARRRTGIHALLLGGVAVLAALLPATTGSAAPVEGATVSSSSYEQTGPHAVTVVQGGPDHTLYYPTDLGSDGVPAPILIWGNGTGATVSQYDVQLRHLASWGFVIAAANTAQSGTGQEMLAGARFLIGEDARPGSVFYGKLDETRVGAAGHSQGGGGAINAGNDPLVDATVPLMPGPQGSVSGLVGPSLFIAGQFDWIVPSFYVRSRYSGATQVPAIFAELKGSDHFFPGDTRIRAIGVVTAWFRFWLSGDEQARSVFFGPTATCGICNDTAGWSSVARNTKALAVPG
jgi:pimeloyl-ACP methyl ester carboxylesterase